MIKVNDRVKIREWDDMAEDYGINGVKIPGHPLVSFAHNMSHLCGLRATVSKVLANGSVELDDWDRIKGVTDFVFMPYMMIVIGNMGKRICVNCKWYEFSGDVHWCTHDVHNCLITGDEHGNLCGNTRYSGDCGREGKLWEPKDG